MTVVRKLWCYWKNHFFGRHQLLGRTLTVSWLLLFYSSSSLQCLQSLGLRFIASQHADSECAELSESWWKQALFTKLKRKKNPACQSPQRRFLIDFHGSWFSLITGGVTVKPESGASEETLLPTWISEDPKPTEPLSLHYRWGLFNGDSGLNIADGGRANCSHTCFYVFLFFFPKCWERHSCVFIPPPRKNPESITSVCLAG